MLLRQCDKPCTVAPQKSTLHHGTPYPGDTAPKTALDTVPDTALVMALNTALDALPEMTLDKAPNTAPETALNTSPDTAPEAMRGDKKPQIIDVA